MKQTPIPIVAFRCLAQKRIALLRINKTSKTLHMIVFNYLPLKTGQVRQNIFKRKAHEVKKTLRED